MKALLIVLVVVLAGCGNTPPTTTQSPPKNVQRAFETAIADELIQEIVTTLPTLGGSARSSYLSQKLIQFNQGVDLALVSERIRQEHRLLQFLVSSELDQWAPNVVSRANALASVSWSADEYERRIQTDLQRLGLDIAEKIGTSISLDIPTLMQQVRADAQYPDDTFEGRQSYLDALADAMYTTQVDWFDLLLKYENSSLAVFGEDSEDFMFRYNEGELTVNLSEVSFLPLDELQPLAAFYGFPGLEALKRKTETTSLRSLLNLPGYELGWAGFIISRMAGQTETTEAFMYFEKLLMSLAWLDLKLNADQINTKEAEVFLAAHTPYEPGRIAMQIREVKATPGRYLAAAAGKLTLMQLHRRCIDNIPTSGAAETSNDVEETGCDASFNQLVVERGVMPFEMLTERFDRQW